MLLNGSSHDRTALQRGNGNVKRLLNTREVLQWWWKGSAFWKIFHLIFCEKSERFSFTSFNLLAFVLNFSIVNCWSAAAFSYLVKIESCLMKRKCVGRMSSWTLSLYLVVGGSNIAIAARAKLYSRWVERRTLGEKNKLHDIPLVSLKLNSYLGESPSADFLKLCPLSRYHLDWM